MAHDLSNDDAGRKKKIDVWVLAGGIGFAIGALVGAGVGAARLRCYVGEREFSARLTICSDGNPYILSLAQVPGAPVRGPPSASTAVASPQPQAQTSKK